VQETHGGDDVGIWAAGPMAHLFHGTHQQTHIGGSIFIYMYIYCMLKYVPYGFIKVFTK
jgi:alkaline phosphatase